MSSPSPGGNKTAPSVVSPPPPGLQGQSAAPFNPNDPSLTRTERSVDGGVLVEYLNQYGQPVGYMIGDSIYALTGEKRSPAGSNINQIKADLDGRVTSGGAQRTSTVGGDKDYGLGAGTEGILVTKRNAQGSPSEYSVRTIGGGYTTTSDLTKAQTLASGYKDWYAAQNPDRTRAAGVAGGLASQQASPSWVAANPTKPADTSTAATGTQVNPGVGEETQKKNASQYDQPSQAEQQWNGLAGQFNNWDASGLEGVYDRGQKKTQVALENRASAGGYGDSSAAARATSNIGQDFTDRKTQAMENWAKTGMGLAGAADSGKNTRLGQQMGEATTAQNLKSNRENGALTSAIQLGQGLAGTTQTATNAADNETASLTTDLANLMLSKGALGQADATAKAKSMVDSLTSMGLTAAQIRTILKQPTKAIA